MLGYCCTGRPVSETAPASVSRVATTIAKIGRSMKNFENTRRGSGYFAAGAPGAAGFAGIPLGGADLGGVTGGAVDVATYGFGASAVPGPSLSPPSTTTRSPARRPSVITQSSPDQSPTVTGRFSALPSLSTTHTKWPFAPCSTARCGTRIAFGRIAPL